MSIVDVAPFLRDQELTGPARPTWREERRTVRRADRDERAKRFAEFSSGQKLVSQRGLLGIRGVALIVISAFHLRYFEVVPGADLAMSLFFTQSGFLITMMILHERGLTGTMKFRRFWGARARRIFPAAWLTLIAVGVVRIVSGYFEVHHKPDTVAMFLHYSNWWSYFTEWGMDAVVNQRSFILSHSWSLSVEEQFYVVMAVVGWLIMTKARRPAIAMRWFAGIGAAVSFSLPVIFGLRAERLYLGTDARAGELLVGVVVGTFLIDRSKREWLLRQRVGVSTSAALALAAIFTMWHKKPSWLGVSEWVEFPVVSALSVLLIAGVMMPSGPASWLMRRRVLLWLGEISYGVYLYHVPIIELMGVNLHTRFSWTLATVVVTLAVASASYYLIEEPIRRRRIDGGSLAVLAVGGFAAVIVTIIFS